MPNDSITRGKLVTVVRQYYDSADANKIRLGQWLCREFNKHDRDIQGMKTNMKALLMFFKKYVLEE